MIEINPLFVILFFEAILILILLALIVPILRNKTNNATQSAALTLVKKLEKNEGSRVERLEQLLAHFGDTNPVLLSEFLEEATRGFLIDKFKFGFKQTGDERENMLLPLDGCRGIDLIKCVLLKVN